MMRQLSDTYGGDSDAEVNTSAEKLTDKVYSLAIYCSSSSSISSIDDIHYDNITINDDVYFDAKDSFEDENFDAMNSVDDDSLFIGGSYSNWCRDNFVVVGASTEFSFFWK